MIPDRVEYMLGSRERLRVLSALSEGAKQQSAISEECGIARSTVHRNLEGFEERGWAEKTENGYVLTVAGRRFLEAYREFTDTVETLTEHEPLLRCLPEFEPELPLSALEGGETTVTSEANPHAVSMALAKLIRRNTGERMRVVTGAISPITNQAAWEALEGGSDIESIIDEGAFETFTSDYGETLEETMVSDGVEAYVSSLPVDVGVIICGQEVGVALSDDVNNRRVCHIGQNPELLAWAETVYDTFRDAATPLSERLPVTPHEDRAR